METKSARGKQTASRNKLPIVIAALVVVLLLLVLGALLLFGGSEPQPTPTEPTTSTQDPSQPSETTPPPVNVPVKVWDMELLPENLIDAGMAYANSSNTIYGNLRIGAGKGKGLGGSTAFAYTFVGNYSDADVYVMSPASLKGQNLISDWSKGEMLWFWVNGTELLQNVRLEITINGKYMPIGPTYYTIDKEGQCVPVGTIPEGWGTTTTRGRIRLNMGWEGWIGLPIEETYGEIKNLTSIQFIVGNSTIKSGNILYLDEFWLTEMGEVPPLSKEELTYSALDALLESLTLGQIWDLETPEVGAQLGSIAATSGRNNPISAAYANKGVSGSKAWGYVLEQANNTNSQNVTMSALALEKIGFQQRAIKDPSNIFWFWVDSQMSGNVMLHLQLNGNFQSRDSIYTIAVKNGQPSIQVVKAYDSKGSVNGVSVVPNTGNSTGTYGRIEISEGWSGWLGIPIKNFCVNSDGTPAEVPAGKLGSFIVRLYAPADSLKAGDGLYFDEFWITEAGKMPDLGNAQLTYGYTASKEKPTVGYGQIWDGGDANNVAAGTQIGNAGAQSDRNAISTIIVDNKGVGGSKAWSYVLNSTDKTNGNNVSMTIGELSEYGFKIANVTATSDILWMWVDSAQSMTQLLHLQINGTSAFMGQMPIFGIAPDAEGKAEIVEIPYYTDANQVYDGVGVVPQGGYARIKLCNGWSGWLGIPVANFCVTSAGEPVELNVKQITQITMRNFASKDTLTAGDTIILDEIWLTPTATMPSLTNEQLLYGYVAPTVPEEPGGPHKTPLQNFDAIEDGSYGRIQANASYTDFVGSIVSKHGLSTSKALKYYFVKSGNTNTDNIFLDQGVHIPEVMIGAETDILWLWIGTDMIADRALHLQMNGNFMSRDTIYTIGDVNNDGKAEIIEVPYAEDPATVTTIAPIDWNNEVRADRYARIKIAQGWSGWIGVSVNSFRMGSDASEKAVLSGPVVSINMRLFSLGTAFTADDMVYFDEFWLTSAGLMPDLSDAALLYTYQKPTEPDVPVDPNPDVPVDPNPDVPVIEHQTPLQNFDLVANGEFGYLNQGYKTGITTALRVAEEIGVLASKGWNYAYVSGGDTNSDNFYLYQNDKGQHLVDVTITSQNDILWFWVNSDLTGMKSLHIQLNGSFLAKMPVYTIGDSNNDGTADIIEVPYVNDPSTVTTMAPVDSNMENADTSVRYGRICFAEGWSGWVGIPVKNFSGNGSTAPAVDAAITEICMRLYTKAKANWNADESITLDEFWLTSPGKMPNLSNEALLYTYTPPVVTEINLTNRFQNGMIFQQNKPWIVNGTGVIGETVTVELINKENATVQTKTATVDADSNWFVTMDAVVGSYDAYTVKVSSGNNTKTIENVVFGEVWAAGGQSNMAYTVYRDPSGDTVLTEADMNALQAELAAYEKAGYIRFFTSSASHAGGLVNEDVTGSWNNASNWEAVRSFSATALYFAKNLEAVLNVPVGVVVGAQGGTQLSAWVDPEIAQADAEFYQVVQDLGYVGGSAAQRAMLGGWFNSRVAAWAGFEVNGFIWYQGEHDSGKPEPQKLGIDVLVASWSKVFNSEATVDALPLVAIQIAPYAASNPSVSKMEETNELNAAMLEGVKALTSKATVVQIYDLFIDITNHHPQHKPALSARAAVAALNLVYDKGTVTSGPVLESADYSIAGQITLTFSNVGSGLKYIQLTEEANKRYEPEGFAMPTDMYVDAINGFSVWTGTEYVDITAAAFVGHNQIVLTLPEGVAPAGVCYGRSMDILTANVYNEEGFPMVPFEHVRPGFTITHKTPLWNADDTAEVVIKDNNASSGRNTSKISIGKFGIGGSNALKYELVTAGNDRTHTWNSGDLGAYGFRTNVSVAAEDDIFWFYLEANVSTVQRLQTYNFNPNGKSIYTLAGTTGNMTLVEVPFGGDDPVEGLALLAHNNTQAQLQIEPGFKGWIGFPVDVLGKNVGDCFSTFSVILLQKDGEDPAGFAGQQVGDHVIFDEFWLTSAGEYPTVATGDQSVKVREQMMDVDSLEGTLPSGSATISSSSSRVQMAISIAEKMGLSESDAIALVIESIGSLTSTGDFEIANLTNMADLGITNNKLNANNDILWFFVDSDFSTDVRMQLQINGKVIHGKPLNSYYIYTIQADANGKPEMVQIMNGSYATTMEGPGVALVNQSGADGNDASLIKVYDGWNGWIGVPMDMIVSGGPTAGKTIDTISFFLRMPKDYDGGISNLSAGEAIYVDEFWLTSAGMMPGLTDEELLWDGADPVVTPDEGEDEEDGYQYPLYNMEQEDDVLPDGAWELKVNATRHDMTASIVANGGLNGSKALSVAISNLYLKNDALESTGHCEEVIFKDLPAMGFADNLTVQAADDILWFWVDSNMSADARVQLTINGSLVAGSPLDTYYIYTISENAEGKPEMTKVLNGRYGDTLEGAGVLVTNQSSGNKNNASLIKFFGGWSGWIGIPMDQLATPVAVGNKIASIGFFIRMQTSADGNANLKAGDHFLFDEFWLTDGESMPKLPDWQLLGKEAPSKVLIDWNKAADATKSDLINAGNAPTVTTNNKQQDETYSMVAYKDGYAASMHKLSTVTQSTYTGWLHLDTTQADAGTVIGLQSYTFNRDDILWIWLDGTGFTEESGGCRLTVTLGGKNMIQEESYYTIGDDGKLVEHKAVNWRDQASNTQGGIVISRDFAGWVGIPLENYAAKGATTLGTFKFSLRRYTSAHSLHANDELIIGNFWIGEKVGDTWAIPTIAEADYI